MARIPGIEIDEIYAKYELHPSLIDIYVEGNFDRDWLNHIFQQKGLSGDISIFTIDGVEISNDFIAEKELKLGSNKHRLIALAMLLSLRLSKIPTNVSCLVDADLDLLLDNFIEERHLIYTDFTCLEMYCLNYETIRKLFILTCNLKNENVDEFFQLANKIIPAQFCIRGVNEELELSCKIPELGKGLADRRDLNTFNADKYVKSFVESNKIHSKSEQVKKSFFHLFSKLPNDIRNKCQGHDFVNLLFDYIGSSSFPMELDFTLTEPDGGGGTLVPLVV